MLVHTDRGQNTTILVRWLANDEGKERTLENLALQKQLKPMKYLSIGEQEKLGRVKYPQRAE